MASRSPAHSAVIKSGPFAFWSTARRARSESCKAQNKLFRVKVLAAIAAAPVSGKSGFPPLRRTNASRKSAQKRSSVARWRARSRRSGAVSYKSALGFGAHSAKSIRAARPPSSGRAACCKESRCTRLTTVGRSADAFSLVSRNCTVAGGSSNNFNSAFCAWMDICSAPASINTRHGASLGRTNASRRSAAISSL